MIALDTNILLYAHDPRYPAKQEISLKLIETVEDGVLLWQVACEYLAASRKLASFGFDLKSAWENIIDLQVIWMFKLPTADVLENAVELMNHYSLSFWDAMIISSCKTNNVSRLYTEDFSAYPMINGIEIINPYSAILTKRE